MGPSCFGHLTPLPGESNELLTGPGAWLQLCCGQSVAWSVPGAPSLVANHLGILPGGQCSLLGGCGPHRECRLCLMSNLNGLHEGDCQKTVD